MDDVHAVSGVARLVSLDGHLTVLLEYCHVVNRLRMMLPKQKFLISIKIFNSVFTDESL